MHPVMQQLSANPSLKHCDLYIDDSSFDMESKSVGDVVHKSMEIWRHVKQAFLAQRLPISTEKSAWVCSSRAVEKKLAAQLGPEDPKIQSCWRDLGVDSAGGKTRRVTIHTQRFVKAAARSKKLSQLTTSGRARSKAAKAGVEAAAAYGHQAVGLASKRMAFLRQLTAVHNGRMRCGSTEIVLDYRCETKPDPSALLVEQHVRSYVSTVARWPSDLEQSLESAFQSIKERVAAHKEPWRIASGPIGATLCYLKEMRWEPQGLTDWTIEGSSYSLMDPVQLEQVARHIHRHWRTVRHGRVANLEASSALSEGIDWTVGKRLLKKLPKAQTNALQAVWQGALRCGDKAWCSLCDKPASQEHLLWTCQWWSENHPTPPEVDRALSKADGSLKVRGLPATVASHVPPRATSLSGLWANGAVLNDPELRYATDGSPGSTGDPPTRSKTVPYKLLPRRRGPFGESRQSFERRPRHSFSWCCTPRAVLMSPWMPRASKPGLKDGPWERPPWTFSFRFVYTANGCSCTGFVVTSPLSSFAGSLGDPRFGAGGPTVQLTSWPGITPTRIVIWSMKRPSQPAIGTLKLSSASWPRGSPCCSLMTRIRVLRFASKERLPLSPKTPGPPECAARPSASPTRSLSGLRLWLQKKDPTNENCFGQRWPTRPWVMPGPGPPSEKTVAGLSAPDVSLGYSKFTTEQKSSVC